MKKYQDESAAVATLRSEMIEKFLLLEEVELRHWSGELLRVDLIGVPRTPWPGVSSIGFEVKKSYESETDALHGLRQCIDYRQSVLVDKRLRKLRGTILSFVFLFPGFDDYEGTGLQEAQILSARKALSGARHLAGKFHVGTVEHRPGPCLVMDNETEIYSMEKGPRLNGKNPNFCSGGHLGSR